MPAAGHVDKEGHFTNTQRLLQWRDKAIEPPGDARSELHFMVHLGRRVKARYADSELDRDWPIRNLAWDYETEGPTEEPSSEEVLKEINGYDLTTGELLDGFAQIKSDGSTACGCWIYSGCFAGGVNQTRNRDAGDLEAPGGSSPPDRAGRGPPTAGSSTTAPPPTRKASRGRSARSTSGGTRRSRSGRATTCPTSRATSLPPTSRRRTPRAWTRSPATRRS